MDLNLYEWLNGLTARHHAVEDLFRFIAGTGAFLFMVLLAVLFFARGKWRSRKRPARRRSGRPQRAAGAGGGADHRLTLGPTPPLRGPSRRGASAALPSPDPSFPSDHATAAFAIAVAIFLRHRKAGTLALILATLVSISRVALGTHYPSDVIGGALLGTAAALVLWAPPVRRPLHRLADWTGALYDRSVEALPWPRTHQSHQG